MSRWTKKQLEKLDNITFAIAILNERRLLTTNSYSLLNQKINKAIAELEEIKKRNYSKCEKIRKATYTSVWDKGIKITTNCKVNMETKEVFDIELSNEDNIESLDTLKSEYITIDGENHNVVNADEGVAEADYWYLL